MDVPKITPSEWLENEERYLNLLEVQVFREKIPLMNVNEWYHMNDSSLVRFQGMIQDMHSPEFYLEKVEVVNKCTNEKTLKTSRYGDIVVNDEEFINSNSGDNVTAERQTFVVISVPGINKWAHVEEEKKFKINIDLSSGNVSKKRIHEESMEVEDIHDSGTSQIENHKKKRKGNTTESPNQSAQNTMSCFPIPDDFAKICHLKVYKNQGELKLNNVYEFVGFLDIDSSTDPIAREDENSLEFKTLYPPTSLVPRIHCVGFRKLQHHNPLLSSDTSPGDGLNLNEIRKELMLLLKPLLLGDELAAEYLLLHLISEVYVRRSFIPLGKFSLNISNVPKFDNLDYVGELYKFITKLVHKSFYLPMTLENLNDFSFIPKKDYETNSLTSGVLQLSDNTHVILDETKLNPGKLTAAGVNNVRAVSSVIRNQKVAYDFNYYPIEYDCDIPFLVLSEGKSMLYSDIHVPLRPDSTCINTYNEILQAADHFLKPALLDDIRRYFTLARRTQYDISKCLEVLVQNDFVKMRQAGSFTGDDLHNLLVSARLVTISQGKAALDEECWRKACALEEERRSRLPLVSF